MSCWRSRIHSRTSTPSCKPRQAGAVTRLLLLADTHLPSRAKDLPAEVWRAVAAAEVVVHAGDWIDVRLLDTLQARAARLIGCWGNNDGPDLRARLPELAATGDRRRPPVRRT